jgi:hypothetical protein
MFRCTREINTIRGGGRCRRRHLRRDLKTHSYKKVEKWKKLKVCDDH